MERHFERELEGLKTTLVKMGSLVDDQLGSACRALFEGDVVRAGDVMARDKEVDSFDTLIDRQCMDIFALTQPVAVDLRLLMSSLAINSQLERIGDIAVNIAERVPALAGHREFLLSTRLAEMANIARIMVRDALDSFIRGDASLASRVLVSDDVVDKLDGGLFFSLVAEMKAHHERVEPAAHILILSRHLERLADHATNIAEDVIFIVEAKLVKHNAGEGVRP
ncbi:MAG TPA: phosphate signaling complex protein PhoU [Bacteroidota bacterium]|nr:phosphate signaling complex protein PhoU [Bacteroidota bacterium]